MRRRSLLAGVLAVAGCGLSERPYEQKRDWPLTVKNPQQRPAPSRGPVLLIRSMQAGPGLETRGLRSLNADGSVRSNFYETWAVPPAQGVEAAMREWLTADGQFAAVLAPGSRMSADYTLEATLTEFIADPGQGVARAAITLVVLETRGDRTQLRAQHALSAEAPLTGSDAPAIAAALRAALEKLLAAVEAALAGLTAPGRPA